MSTKIFKLIAAIIAGIMLLTAMAGCGQNVQQQESTRTESSQAVATQASTETPKEIVTIKSIFPGDEPKGLSDVFTVLNEKLGKDIGVNLSLTWAPWDQYGNKIQMAIAAGEEIDWFWGGSSDLSVNVAKKIVAPLDDLMAKYGKSIYDNIKPELFDTMKIDGKLMGIPSTGNSPLVNVYHSFSYREDLRVKYNLPKLDNIQNMDLYFKTIKEKEPTLIPLCSASAAYVIMPAFGPEDYLGGTNGAVAVRVNEDNSVTLMRIQDAPAFKDSLAKAREWYNAGYIPKDILNIGDEQAKLNAGAAACKDGSALQSSEQQASIVANVPEAILNDQPVMGSGKKFIMGNGGNAVYLSPVSKHPDQVVQFWAWIFASQDNYDLYCYGIKDKNYKIDNDRLVYLNSDYSSFPAWMFKNLNYLRFNQYATDEYINTIKNWDSGAVISPLQGFVFNPEKVSTELAQVNNVFGAYSKALNAGMTDFAKVLPEFNSKMKAAGQDTILEEVQKQVDAFLKK
jgi:putative aldouronate transport system substrate-binding protein